MKKVFLGLCFMLIYSMGFSQSVSSFFKDLEKSSEYAVVKVNKEMFELLAAMDTELQGTDVQDLIKGLKEITIFIKERNGAEDYEKFQGLVSSSSKLKSYMSFKEDDNDVNLYSSGTTADGKLNGIVLSVNDDDQTIFINVDGLVDIAALGKLTENIEIDGLNHLKKLKEKDVDKEKE